MNIQYQLSKEAFMPAMRIIMRKLSKMGKRVVIACVVCGFVLLCIPLQMLWSVSSECAPLFSPRYFELLFNNTYKVAIIIGFWAASIACFVNAYRFPDDQFKKWVKNPLNQSAFEHKTISVSENGIHFVSSGGDESKVVWQTFGRIVQVHDFFFLEVQENGFVIVPKMQMTQEEVAYLDCSFEKYVLSEYEVRLDI